MFLAFLFGSVPNLPLNSGAYHFLSDLDDQLALDDFRKINAPEQALVWWQRAHPRFLWGPFVEFNRPFGYLRMRMQQVQVEVGGREDCAKDEIVIAAFGNPETAAAAVGPGGTGDFATVMCARGSDSGEDRRVEKVGFAGLQADWTAVDIHNKAKAGNYGRGKVSSFCRRQEFRSTYGGGGGSDADVRCQTHGREMTNTQGRYVVH